MLLFADFLRFTLNFLKFYISKMEDGDFDQRLRDLQREYLEFLDDEVSVHITYYIYKFFEA